jgi:hypothetical protein
MCALLVVVSGVAAVSAFEAHAINVKAKVENALSVPTTSLHFGTMFPEEFFLTTFQVRTSESFCASSQTRMLDIDYEVWAEWKVLDDNGTPDPGDDTYYPWLGEAAWLAYLPWGTVLDDLDISGDFNCTTQGFDPPDGTVNLADDTFPDRTVWFHVGSAPDGPPGAKPVMGSLGLHKPAAGGIRGDRIALAIDSPVFEEYYNALTDVCPKPNGLDKPTWVIASDDPRHVPGGIEMGLDLKIQVVRIYNDGLPPP